MSFNIKEEAWTEEEARFFIKNEQLGLFQAKRIIERYTELSVLTVWEARHKLLCPCKEEFGMALEKNLESKLAVERNFKTLVGAMRAEASLDRLELEDRISQVD